MTAIKCDRCKGYFCLEDMDNENASVCKIEEITYYSKKSFLEHKRIGGLIRIDLCCNCTRAFEDFLNGSLVESEITSTMPVSEE